MNAASLCFVYIEAERAGLHGILAARLQDEADRRAREPVKDHPAHRHEAERDPVIDLVVDRDHVRHGEADLTARKPRRHDHEVLQHEHGDERGEAEIRPPHAQGRQRQHDASRDRRGGAGDQAKPDRGLVEVVENAGRVGAEPDQEGRAEIHFVGEAEQEVPGHREHAEIIGDGQEAEYVTRDVERQCRGERDDEEADPQGARRQDAPGER